MLPSIERAIQDHTTEWLLALTLQDLHHNPHLYLQRLLLVPQLPASTLGKPNNLQSEARAVTPSDRLLHKQETKPKDLLANDEHVSLEDASSLIQEALPSPEFGEARYQTKWNAQMTFEEIYTNQNVRNVAFAKMRSFGYEAFDAEDAFQSGSLSLWRKLQEQPDLLCDKGAAWVGVWIALSGSHRALWKHKMRNVSLKQSKKPEAGERETTESYLSGSPERWAGFATKVDERIDFALLMSALAQRYDADPMKLLALYSLTTSVKMKDLLPLAKAHKNQFIQVRHAVKNDLKDYLEQGREENIDDEFWRPQSHSQEKSVQRVAEHVMDNPRLLLALYVITTTAKRKDVIDLFGLKRTTFRKDIAHVKCLLAEHLRKLKRTCL